MRVDSFILILKSFFVQKFLVFKEFGGFMSTGSSCLDHRAEANPLILHEVFSLASQVFYRLFKLTVCLMSDRV
jgi:hypothetical protein